MEKLTSEGRVSGWGPKRNPAGVPRVHSPLELWSLLPLCVTSPALSSKNPNMVHREETSENTFKECWD